MLAKAVVAHEETPDQSDEDLDGHETYVHWHGTQGFRLASAPCIGQLMTQTVSYPAAGLCLITRAGSSSWSLIQMTVRVFSKEWRDWPRIGSPPAGGCFKYSWPRQPDLIKASTLITEWPTELLFVTNFHNWPESDQPRRALCAWRQPDPEPWRNLGDRRRLHEIPCPTSVIRVTSHVLVSGDQI